MVFRLGLLLILVLAMAAPAAGQFAEGDPGGTKLGQSQTQKWRCGIIVTAAGGPCLGLSGYVPVPVDWPEQQVKVVQEDVSPGVKIGYQIVDGTAKIMTVKIAQLESGKEAKALVTFEIRRSALLAPEDTDGYRLAEINKLDRSVRPFLAPSKKIESNNAKIRELSKTIGSNKKKAWERVEAIYDWVREHVKYQTGPLKGAMGALKDKTGDCEDMSSLFIAICRAANIPARTVWVHSHCYAEFYLVDSKGEGHWFPCQLAGSRAFGCMSETKPILQKGDNFRPPFNPHERQRYLSEHLTGTPTANGGTPRVKFVREVAN